MTCAVGDRAGVGVRVVVAVSVGEIAVGVGVAVGLLQLPKSTIPRTAIKAKKTGCIVRFTVLLPNQMSAQLDA